MQEDYHLLVDSIKDYAIYRLDKSGNIVTWNAGAERMKGYKEEEIVGKHFSMLFTLQDAEKGKPQKELATALPRGRYEEEGWRVKKDGSRFWANIILTPMFSDDGEHLGFAKVTRDLTEKRRSEELYLLFVSQVKEYALFMLDPTGHILTWNEGAEYIKGYTAHEIIGKHFSTFYLPEDNEANKPARELDTALRTGKYEEEGWRLRKDGSRFWANVVITPIYKDTHIGFAKVTRDLTKRKELEQLMRANAILDSTNKELERFAFTASHDMKAPIRKIATFAEILLREDTGQLSEIQQAHLRRIETASQKMLTLVDDILSYSSLTRKPQFENISLEEIVGETLELLEDSIEDKQAEVHYKGLPNAIVIPSQMQQLFQNLISNSLKFSKAQVAPVIKIQHQFLNKWDVEGEELWPSEQYLQLRIIDNGIGFEQDYAERIFDLFDRLHGKTTYEGSGVGLAICKKITENHGGLIKAKSSPGNGAEFTVVLPA